MPTHRVWNETGQDIIRIKNLIKEAERQLVDRGLRKEEALRVLAPAKALENDRSFWKTQGDGLALFLSNNGFQPYRLPVRFDEQVVVNDRFHIKPLLGLFETDGTFYLLSLTLDDIRLFSGTRFSLEEHALEDTPLSLDEALRFDVFEKHQQSHSGAPRGAGSGNRAATFHGQGGAADDANMKKRIKEFFRKVDNGVRKVLTGTQMPLMLAGLDHLRGIYREVNHYPHLLTEHIAYNPSELTGDELHERAWSQIEPHFLEPRKNATMEYEQRAHNEPERISDHIEQIVPAAYFKRVKVLIVRKGAEVWGAFDPDSQAVQVHEQRQADNQDLIDFAVVHTVQNAGEVYFEKADNMPGEANIAAIYRF